MIDPLEMIVFPPRMMFWGPAIVARRETLFPVSWITSEYNLLGEGLCPTHSLDELRLRVENGWLCAEGRARHGG
jgi:hypothetical protein